MVRGPEDLLDFAIVKTDGKATKFYVVRMEVLENIQTREWALILGKAAFASVFSQERGLFILNH